MAAGTEKESTSAPFQDPGGPLNHEDKHQLLSQQSSTIGVIPNQLCAGSYTNLGAKVAQQSGMLGPLPVYTSGSVLDFWMAPQVFLSAASFLAALGREDA